MSNDRNATRRAGVSDTAGGIVGVIGGVMAMQVPGPLLLIVPIFVGMTMTMVVGLNQRQMPFNFSLRQHRRIMSRDIHRRRE